MNNTEEVQHYLDVLLKESNFTRSAKQLHISQPYLTQVIQRLEKRLGTVIIKRDAAPFSLTAAGLIYYQYLEQVNHKREELGQKLLPYTRDHQQLLRLGIDQNLGSYLLGQLLPQYLKQNPTVFIQLTEDLPAKNEKRLLNGTIDCYLGQTPASLNRQLRIFTNGQEQYYVVIPDHSRFYQKERFILHPSELDLKELLAQPFILSSPSSVIRHQVNHLFAHFHLRENIRLVSTSMITVTNLAVHGVGLTISTASFLKRNDQLPINLLPLSPDLISGHFFLAINKKEKSKTELQKFISNFQQTNLTAKM